MKFNSRYSVTGISIHAPRMGSDFEANIEGANMPKDFNPRSPHGERLQHTYTIIGKHIFQSTLPAWGATRAKSAFKSASHDFNPRSPHGERPPSGFSVAEALYFNPRSPHGERLVGTIGVLRRARFQSTLPAWGATSETYQP